MALSWFAGMIAKCRVSKPLKVTVFDHNDNGKHLVIGEFETTIGELQAQLSIKGNADREQAIPLGVEGKFKTYGLLCVLKATVVEDKPGV